MSIPILCIDAYCNNHVEKYGDKCTAHKNIEALTADKERLERENVEHKAKQGRDDHFIEQQRVEVVKLKEKVDELESKLEQSENDHMNCGVDFQALKKQLEDCMEKYAVCFTELEKSEAKRAELIVELKKSIDFHAEKLEEWKSIPNRRLTESYVKGALDILEIFYKIANDQNPPATQRGGRVERISEKI